MSKRYIDDILEDVVINQLIKVSEIEDKNRELALARLNVRIAELDAQLRSDEWREDVKRKIRVWRSSFIERRNELINKYKVRYE